MQLRQICSHCEIVKVVWIYFIINFTESNFLWKRQFDNTVNSEELSNYVKEWEKTKDREREFKKPPVYLMKKYVWILSRSSVSFIRKIISTQKKASNSYLLFFISDALLLTLSFWEYQKFCFFFSFSSLFLFSWYYLSDNFFLSFITLFS